MSPTSPLPRILLACALLPIWATQAWPAIVGTCTIMIGGSGTMAVNPAITTLGSKQAGGAPASATIVTNSLLCSVLNLLDCYSVSAPAPSSFLAAPSGGGDNVTFATVFRLDGGGTDFPGDVPLRVTNGNHPIQVDVAAGKSSGIFRAGAYQAQITVRCE